MSNKNCTYTFLDGQGQQRTIMGLSSMKAFLVDGGLDLFYPSGKFPWLSTESAIDMIQPGPVERRPKLTGRDERYPYPAKIPGQGEADAAAKNKVVDYMNGDISRTELMNYLSASGLPEGKIIAFTQRMQDDGPSLGEIRAMLDQRKLPKQSVKPASYGAKNTLVTADRAAELRERLKKKLNQLNAGIDPEMLAIGVELAAFHLEAGVRKFADFAQAMASDLDVPISKIRPYLRSWYNGARDMMEDSGLDIEGMDSPSTVRDELNRIETQEAKPDEQADNGQVGQRDPSRAPADGGERGGIRTQAPNDGAPSGALGEQQSEAVAQPQADESGAASGSGAAPSDVSADDRSGASGDAANGRPRTGRARNPDAGAGTGAGAGKRPGGTRPPAAGVPADGGGVQGQPGVSPEQAIQDAGLSVVFSTGDKKFTVRLPDHEYANAVIKRDGDAWTFAARGLDTVRTGSLADMLSQAKSYMESVRDGATSGVSANNPAKPGPGDYVMADPMRVVGGGQVARFNKNKAAIELRNQLIESGRKPTPEEQEILAGYTGWGSFGQDLFQGTWARPAPKQGWEERDRWLRDNLGQSEWEGMQASIINAHYTDPPTVLAMWDMVRRMGFKGGRTLEPSLGIGNFYAMMPVDMASRSQRAGIELDPMTGSMAQLLYPNANIQIKGYQDSKTPDNFYDLVIGNWPFFEHGPADRRYNRLKPTLHDYFFLKALDQTKPGGLVVGITTHGTMDKKGIGARVEMARKAELVAAFRLPTGAFEEYAGTKVVTDIIILRKRAEPLGVVANEDWIDTVEMPTPSGTPVTVNKYFQLNPQNVIGQIDFGHGTTTFAPGLIVHRPADMMEQLRRIVELTPEGAFLADTPAKTVAYLANHTGDRTGAMVYDDKGFHVVQGEYLVPISERKKYALKSDAATQAREDQFRSLIDMRRAYGRLVEAERSGNAEGERKVLRDQYEAFVGKYGPLTESYGLGYFKAIDDPFYPSLAALEVPGQQPGSFRPATILSESTTRGKTRMQNPSVRDAFVMARSESVSPSLEDIAQLAETTVEQAKAELLASGAGFELPNGDFAPADVYLSGNVREKMRQAKAALEMGNAGMEVNIQALAEVIPENIPYYKIETQMGATWVPPKTYAEYVAHMLGLGVNTDGIEVTFKAGSWKIDFPSGLNFRAEANSGYGSSSVKFKRLVNAAISNQTINVKRKDDKGDEYIDIKLTEEANGKIADMRLKFGEWLWSDPVRRSELETEYNEVRNAYATPKFDGSFLGFEGMALSLGRGPFNLRQHQVNAIWRALVTRKSLNAHEVGTGKTFTMGGIAVESRRYGIAKKPILFAHNANSKSVAHEIQMMYPAAKVLYLDNLSKENVKTRMLQIANDDWDVVVMPHSLIDRIGFKKETLEAMAKEEIADLELAAQEAAEEDDAIITSEMWDDDEELKKLRSPTAKQLVKARMKIKQEIERLSQQASREDSVAFEDLGIDMVLVDEAHEFKKPPLATKMKMKGLQTATSNRSINLMFLTKYVRAMNAGGNVHLFTGTPITNTMTEVFHMMRYMMQEEMQDASLADWDGWFGSFAREVQDVELSSTGEYEVVTRLQSFINVPELRRMIGQYMDVVFADDMPEMKPRMVNGKTMASKDLTELDRAALLNGRTENAADRPYKKVVNESSDMTPEQLEIFNRVKGWAARFRSMTRKERKEAMSRGAPESPIVHDGIAAKASFDVRLVDAIGNAGKEGSQEMEPHPDSKPARVTKNLLEIYRSHGQAAQVVFMSQGMAKSVTRREGPPGNKRDVRYPAFSTMHDMIERLVQAGIPRDEIAFVDGSTSKDKRKEVADAMNSGKIRIVFGSTGSLGVGVNMQRNLRAMHHMDAPWMPGDLEQRNGRGHRQGNQWNTVLEYRYLTDRLDGRRWQVLAIKQRFITDFMKSKGDVRVIEGDATGDGDSEGGGDILATFSDAAGDPRVLLREKYKKSLDQMLARERLHGAAQVEAKRTVDAMRRDLDSYERQLSKLREAGTPQKVSDFLDSVRGDGFRLVLNGQAYTNRTEATDAVRAYVTSELRQGEDRVIGTYGDRELIAEWPRLSDQPMLMVEFDDFTAESNGASLASLDGSMRRYRDEAEAKLLDAIDISKRTAKHAQSVMDEPFHMADKLLKLEQTLSDLEADITKNPVAPPYWLRTGAPADAPVYWNDQPFIVTGHRWSDAGWFVLAADDKGDVVIPYLEAKDSQGIPVYEAREFNAPVVNTKEEPAAGQEDAAASNVSPSVLATTNDADPVPQSQWLSEAKVAQTIEERIGQFRHQPPVIVLDSVTDLPHMRDAGAGAAKGMTFGGKIYLFRDANGTVPEIVETLWHELVHYGLRRFLTKGQYIGQMQKLHDRDLWIKAKADQWLATKGDDVQEAIRLGGMAYARARGVDEALAELAQANRGDFRTNTLKAKAIRQVARWIAAMAERFGFDAFAAKYRAVSNDEARALVKEMFQKLSDDAPATSMDWAFTADAAFARPGAAAQQATQPSAWAEPGMTSFDNFVYKLQDKHVDTKRVQAAITKTAGEIEDELNAYQREELYHGRAAKRAQDFLTQELNPMVEQLAKDKIELADFEEFLHARHAPEANRVLAERNPNQDMIDAGLEAATLEIEQVELELAATTDPTDIKLLSRRMREAQAELSKWSSVQAYRGTEEDRLRLSGMSDDQARAIMDALTPEQRAKLDDAAAQFDAIVGQNRQLMVDYDLEDQETIDGWGQLFQHYVPLMREDEGNGVQQGMGTGQGFSIKGREVKSRTGSTRKVVDIVANVAMQRERIITRGEKNRVSQALMGLAALNPNPDFWKLGAPDRKRQYDPATNTVKVVTDPQYKNRENVVVAKVRNSKGRVTEVALTFNERDERAVRMAAAIKNLEDSQLGTLMSMTAKVTRYLASVNTQYNPIFGVVNLVRDLQGAAVNLAGTPLANSKAKVIKNAVLALADIYLGARQERKGTERQTQWGRLWQEFQEVGGMTGFRDQFRNSGDRARAIERTMNPEKWMESAFGNVITAGGLLKAPMTWVQDGGGWVLDLLSDYNLAMENGVRLATYKEGLDKGLTQEQAASLAKNLTVNFNRRGSVGLHVGSAYAFFNAAMQGTARMGQALTTMEDGKLSTLRLSSLGKQVVAGGLAMGVAQAVALAMAGFGDDEPPQFVREKNMVIPTGWTGIGSDKGYLTIPMPLGLHVIPGLGRHMAEFAMSGGKDPAGRTILIMGMLLDAFNPIGNAGMSLQTLTPTVLDPLAALGENKDFTGRNIALESRNPNAPGHTLARDTASSISKLLSEAINTLTGGNEYVSGVLSPTPDQIDYLIGQVTGGVGRELMKVEQTVSSAVTGEELPLYKVPLVGRFAGDSNGSGGQSTIYRANVNRLDRAEMEIDGLRKDGRIQESNDLRQRSDPYLLAQARAAESQVQRLRRMKRDMVDKGASRESVREVERKISEAMGRLNKAVESRAK